MAKVAALFALMMVLAVTLGAEISRKANREKRQAFGWGGYSLGRDHLYGGGFPSMGFGNYPRFGGWGGDNLWGNDGNDNYIG